MFSKKELKVIKELIEKSQNSKIYLGSDSHRVNKNRVRYATVVIIHFFDENKIGKGAKVFHDIEFKDTKDALLSKPFNRMMEEVSMVTRLYSSLEDVLILRDFEIHIDVNPDESAGSNVAFDSAKWTIFGLTGVEPICKPFAFAASCAADRYSK